MGSESGNSLAFTSRLGRKAEDQCRIGATASYPTACDNLPSHAQDIYRCVRQRVGWYQDPDKRRRGNESREEVAHKVAPR
jgi:hypothetical protein